MQVHLALFSFGGFAENLAIDPRKVTSASELPEGSEGHHFLGATAGFFHSFYSLLDQENMITFNELFRRLSTKDVWLDRISLYNLRSMQHLLIDEFQDVSKAIVNLILGLHTRLKELSDGRIQPTLMCVGDDWQSIYGWRGSSPKFFMNFAQYFPGSRKVPVELNENFRSSQKVILAGESSLSGLQERIAKKNGLARHKEFAECSHPVLLISDHKGDDAVHIVKSILNLKSEDEKVFVLTRSNNDSTFEGIVAACRDWDESSLVATTIHQSKGLEAEYVVIIGDTVSFGSNPLHNALYKLSGLTQKGVSDITAYDDAQRDEALRIAYVAITRAKKVCIWLGPEKSRGTFDNMPTGTEFCHRISCKDLNVHTLCQ